MRIHRIGGILPPDCGKMPQIQRGYSYLPLALDPGNRSLKSPRYFDRNRNLDNLTRRRYSRLQHGATSLHDIGAAEWPSHSRITLMTPLKKVTAIVGSYRKGGTIDLAVDEILSSAKDAGAETDKIYLIDKQVEFCTNCRRCTQEPGPDRGICPIADDVPAILDQLEASDAIVLGSPMNFFTVTAVTKRLIERMVCYADWPWGQMVPKERKKKQLTKKAVVVTSSAAPAFVGRLITGIVGLLKTTARLVGAKTIGVLYIGLAAQQEQPKLSAGVIRKARRLGQKLVAE
jgi:NAD(P)H-dependent FMN reductase